VGTQAKDDQNNCNRNSKRELEYQRPVRGRSIRLGNTKEATRAEQPLRNPLIEAVANLSDTAILASLHQYRLSDMRLHLIQMIQRMALERVTRKPDYP
jgi:hypothetical protein